MKGLGEGLAFREAAGPWGERQDAAGVIRGPDDLRRALGWARRSTRR